MSTPTYPTYPTHPTHHISSAALHLPPGRLDDDPLQRQIPRHAHGRSPAG